ncbi:phage tail tube protein [Acidovorax sp. Leaf160]|uniref:phage tail tube protein n=1 Tax=Acidovorax sp. Leaf160 TaxID=1736280 RepID=UPI0006FFB642|nr:phage tail tube protein [Acidovorax sp. Leaf160]KQR55634.1 hypothetical protein ASF94_04310 [Acidovorax sp. Leaf160]
MAYYFPEGSRFQFATVFETAKGVSAVTNTNPAQASSNAHGYAQNDELLFTSGWEDASDTIWRAGAVAANTVDIKGLNASSTNMFPAGGGTGTLQKVGGWVEIPQVLNIQGNGGDPKFNTVDPLSRRNAINVPVGFNPMSLTLTLGHDASLPAYQQMLDVSRVLGRVGFKIIISGGAVGYGYGYMAVSEMPNLTKGQANSVPCSISLLGRFITYAGA